MKLKFRSKKNEFYFGFFALVMKWSVNSPAANKLKQMVLSGKTVGMKPAEVWALDPSFMQYDKNNLRTNFNKLKANIGSNLSAATFPTPGKRTSHLIYSPSKTDSNFTS